MTYSTYTPYSTVTPTTPTIPSTPTPPTAPTAPPTPTQPTAPPQPTAPTTTTTTPGPITPTTTTTTPGPITPTTTLNPSPTATVLASEAQKKVLYLYDAIRNRLPTASEFTTYVSALTGGQLATTVAKSMITVAGIVTQSKDSFLDTIYTNVTGQAAPSSVKTAAGPYASSQPEDVAVSLAFGANQTSAMAATVSAFESNQSSVVNRTTVQSLYKAVNGSMPDTTTLNTHLNSISSGTSLTAIAKSIITSAGIVSKSKGDFIDTVYQNIYGRSATAAEHSLVQSSFGAPNPEDVVLSIATSSDAQSAMGLNSTAYSEFLSRGNYT